MLVLLLKIILYPLSVLPLALIRFLLYPFQWFVEFILKYRRERIIQNLHIAFPNESFSFYTTTLHGFYNNLFNLIAESIKSFTASRKEAIERMVIKNPEFLNHYYNLNQSVAMVFGHFNNWEWTAIACPPQQKHQLAALYQPIKNIEINNWIRTNRSREGAIVISTKEAKEFYQNNPPLHLMGFIADQSPSKNGNGVWVDFFNRKTLFLSGFAYYAQKYNMPLVFVDIQFIKTGYYSINVEMLSEKPWEEPIEKIVQLFATRLEKQIKEKPENWLWSHNKWKHKYTSDEQY